MTLERIYSIEEVLATWPEAIRPSERTLRELARRHGHCRRLGRAIWDFLEDLEDIMVAIFVEMKCSGQLPDFSIKKYPTIWNDLDIPEEMVLACGRK